MDNGCQLANNNFGCNGYYWYDFRLGSRNRFRSNRFHYNHLKVRTDNKVIKLNDIKDLTKDCK